VHPAASELRRGRRRLGDWQSLDDTEAVRLPSVTVQVLARDLAGNTQRRAVAGFLVVR